MEIVGLTTKQPVKFREIFRYACSFYIDTYNGNDTFIIITRMSDLTSPAGQPSQAMQPTALGVTARCD
jgi:hypothetical protein